MLYLLNVDVDAHPFDVVFESADDGSAMSDMWCHIHKAGRPVVHVALYRLLVGRLDRLSGEFGTTSITVFDNLVEDDDEPDEVLDLVGLCEHVHIGEVS